MGRQHSHPFQIRRLHPTEIVVSIYMDKIFLQLHFITHQSNIFTVRFAFYLSAIYCAQRLNLLGLDRQTFKKDPVQSIFKRFIPIQTLGRKLPIPRKWHPGGPFTHQNPAIFPYYTANSKHFSPILELLSQLFILISFIFLLNLQISYMIDTFCRFGKGVEP